MRFFRNMDGLSKDKMIAVIETALTHETFDRFVLAHAYSSHKLSHGEHTFFTGNRISHVLEGQFNLMLGSDNNFERKEIPAGSTLLMRPYCCTDTMDQSRCAFFGFVCLSECLRLFYVNSMDSGLLSAATRYFYHISDTYRLCTANAIATLCTLEPDALYTQFGTPLMRLVWLLILQDLKASSINEFGKAHNLWFQIRDFISSFPAEKINRQLLADHFHVTETYISILFTQFANTTFKGYLQREKLEKAVTLLHNTNMTINEIAFKSGFDSASYFIRIFKSVYHVSPGAWRRIKK